jgi:D-alanyl-D-alanine dipeptidase
MRADLHTAPRDSVPVLPSAPRGGAFPPSPALIAIAASLWLACSPPTQPELVDLADVAPDVAVEMRYAGSENFVGEPIAGYQHPRCLLTPPAARALARVQRDLESRGMGLLVYDCYRPQRAVDRFVRWAEDASDQRNRQRYYPRVPKSQLFEQGYIARRSSHSRGSTVDLTLVRRDRVGGISPVDMGGHFDLFDPSSHTDSTEVGELPRRHRRLLRDAMNRAGFENLPEEWWHYTLRDEPYPDRYWDVVIRCGLLQIPRLGPRRARYRR